MKKLLTILGAAGLVATTGATVVACGTTDVKAYGGDDLTDLTHKWKLDEYNIQPGERGIWLTDDLYTINEGEDEEAILDLNLDAKTLSQLIWTGILNADIHENALKDFNDKKLWTVLHFTGNVNTIIKENFKFAEHGDGEMVITLKEDISINLGMKLDVDLKSKTDQSNPVESGLIASEMNFTKGLTIHLMQAEK